MTDNNDDVPKHRLQPDRMGNTNVESARGRGYAHYNLAEASKRDDSDIGDLSLLPEGYPEAHNVTRVKTHEGLVLARHDPNGFYRVVCRYPDNGRELPPEISCSFTNYETAVRAINRWKGIEA